MRPSIVITGSGAPEREYKPKLKDAAAIPAASAAIGRELALAGCDLVVFSSSDNYIEKDVVKGYLDALDVEHQGAVVACVPFDHELDFGAPEYLKHVIKVRPDPATEWEISYYRALFEADGLVLIGGGRATRIAGVMALARRTPILAIACFGASALTVWQNLNRHRNDATDADLHQMAEAWGPDSAARLVQSLLRQLSRRQEQMREQEQQETRAQRARTRNGLWATIAIIVAGLTVLMGFQTQSTAAAVGYLLAGPLLAAVAGALLRDASEKQPNAIWSAARGLGAGVLAAMLYVGSQQLTNAAGLDAEAARRLSWFLVPIGLVAGYTVDLVFARLRNIDVLSDQPLKQS